MQHTRTNYKKENKFSIPLKAMSLSACYLQIYGVKVAEACSFSGERLMCVAKIGSKSREPNSSQLSGFRHPDMCKFQPRA